MDSDKARVINNSISMLSGLEFERFVFNILVQEALSLGKKLYPYSGSSDFLYSNQRTIYASKHAPFDAFAPYGLYDDVPTIIEIKKIKVNTQTTMDKANQMVKRFNEAIDKYPEIRRCKLLLITNLPKELTEYIGKGNNQLFIWSIDDLLGIARKYPIDYNAALELAISKYSNNKESDELRGDIVNASPDQFKQHNTNVLHELERSISENGIDLVLGTGVSMDYNNKLTWKKLADDLYSALPPSKQFNNTDDALTIMGGDNISKAQYSIVNLGDSYASALHKLLYPKKYSYSIGGTSLDECANLICKNTKNNLVVKKVITYNYDNYLEQALSARGFPFKILYRENDCLDNNFPIYHVHGYMPEDVDTIKKRQLIKSIVLSEEDYFNCYSDSSNWRVVIQLVTFKDDTCLFVGNSISDFNEKRLLNKTKQTKPHFAIIYSKGLGIGDLTKLHMHFYYMLNIKIVWVEKLSDIPVIIKSIADRLL